MLEVGAHRHLQAVGRFFRDLRAFKDVGAVDVAGDTVINGLGGGHGDEDLAVLLFPASEIEAAALHRVLHRQVDGIGLRVGGQAGRHAGIVLVDRREVMRCEPRTNDADDAHEQQVPNAHHGGLVGLEAVPRIGPEGAALGGAGERQVSHSAPVDRPPHRGCRR